MSQQTLRDVGSMKERLSVTWTSEPWSLNYTDGHASPLVRDVILKSSLGPRLMSTAPLPSGITVRAVCVLIALALIASLPVTLTATFVHAVCES